MNDTRHEHKHRSNTNENLDTGNLVMSGLSKQLLMFAVVLGVVFPSIAAPTNPVPDEVACIISTEFHPQDSR